MAGSQGRSSAVWGVAAAIVLLMSCGGASAALFEVGGTNPAGWTIPSTSNGLDYSTWAASNTYRVGDVLHFTYAVNAHNVQPLPDLASYTACDFSTANKSLLLTSGSDNFTLTTPGNVFIACEISGHCGLGMKFQINVLAAAPASAPALAPVVAPTRAPVAAPTRTPTTAPTTTPTTPAAPGPEGVSSPGPSPSASSAPLSIVVSGSVAAIVLASTMVLSSLF